jgi:cysteine desulfurase
MGIPVDYAMGTIRFSTGRYNTKDQLKIAANMVIMAVKELT